MKDRYSGPLTDAEREQLKPALDKVDLALDELDGALARIGRPPDEGEFEEGSFRCLVPGCTCPHFKPRGLTLICATPRCGHRFTRHDVR